MAVRLDLHRVAGIEKDRSAQLLDHGRSVQAIARRETAAQINRTNDVSMRVVERDLALPALAPVFDAKYGRRREPVREASECGEPQVDHHDGLARRRVAVVLLMKRVEARANRAEVFERAEIFGDR